jgi:hypothetical protein
MERTSGRLEQVLVLGGADTVSNGVEGALRSALSQRTYQPLSIMA